MGPLCIRLRVLFHFVYYLPTGCVWLHSHFLRQLASVAFGEGDIYICDAGTVVLTAVSRSLVMSCFLQRHRRTILVYYNSDAFDMIQYVIVLG